MSTPEDPGRPLDSEWPDPESPDGDVPESGAAPEPLLWRVLRSTIAPDVLRDGGHDAPLSPRGRILFWGAVGGLTLAIAVLFVVTLSK